MKTGRIEEVTPLSPTRDLVRFTVPGRWASHTRLVVVPTGTADDWEEITVTSPKVGKATKVDGKAAMSDGSWWSFVQGDTRMGRGQAVANPWR